MCDDGADYNKAWWATNGWDSRPSCFVSSCSCYNGNPRSLANMLCFGCFTGEMTGWPRLNMGISSLMVPDFCDQVGAQLDKKSCKGKRNLEFNWISSEKSVLEDFTLYALKDFTQSTNTCGCASPTFLFP